MSPAISPVAPSPTLPLSSRRPSVDSGLDCNSRPIQTESYSSPLIISRRLRPDGIILPSSGVVFVYPQRKTFQSVNEILDIPPTSVGDFLLEELTLVNGFPRRDEVLVNDLSH